MFCVIPVPVANCFHLRTCNIFNMSFFQFTEFGAGQVQQIKKPYVAEILEMLTNFS